MSVAYSIMKWAKVTFIMFIYVLLKCILTGHVFKKKLDIVKVSISCTLEREKKNSYQHQCESKSLLNVYNILPMFLCLQDYIADKLED